MAKKTKTTQTYFLSDRNQVKALLLIIILFGLMLMAVGFFNLGIQANEQYYRSSSLTY